MTVRKRKVEEALQSWIALNKAIGDFSEEEVAYALELETGREIPRPTFVERLEMRMRGVKIEELRKELGG